MLMADPHIQRSYLALLCKSQLASLLFFTFLLSFFVYSVSFLHQGYEFKPHECLTEKQISNGKESSGYKNSSSTLSCDLVPTAKTYGGDTVNLPSDHDIYRGEILNRHDNWKGDNNSSSLKNHDFSMDNRSNMSGSLLEDKKILNFRHQLQEIVKEHKLLHCDIYTGKWVKYDEKPLYHSEKCKFNSGTFDCQANGRPDSDYVKWKWQPNYCTIPRMNATLLLGLLRNRRLMFVGDSHNRGQWESLLCIIANVVPQDKIEFSIVKGSNMYLIKDYNATIEYYLAPFLVEQVETVVGNTTMFIVKLDHIQKHGLTWKNVDVLVFNSGHWWTHGNRTTMKFSFQESGILHPNLDRLTAFEKALTTWRNWIDQNIDEAKIKVFFRGYSATHYVSRQWDKRNAFNCYKEIEPIFDDKLLHPYPRIMKIVDKVLTNMKVPVSLMNITRLSDYRKDAHTSIYGHHHKKPLTQQQKSDPKRWADCLHWCLPGLPDTWNEMLYVSLIMQMYN